MYFVRAGINAENKLLSYKDNCHNLCHTLPLMQDVVPLPPFVEFYEAQKQQLWFPNNYELSVILYLLFTYILPNKISLWLHVGLPVARPLCSIFCAVC